MGADGQSIRRGARTEAVERRRQVRCRLADGQETKRECEDTAYVGAMQSGLKQGGRTRAIERRTEDGGKIPAEAREVDSQFTCFGSDQADRLVTMSNCLSR
jgi:hypothetical protein